MTNHLPLVLCATLLIAGCTAVSGPTEAGKKARVTVVPTSPGSARAGVADMPTTAPSTAMVRVYRSRQAGAGQSCLAGSHFDPEQARSVAAIMLWNDQDNRLRWSREIPLRADFVDARAVECIAWNGGYAVLVDSDTQAPPSRRQTFSSLYWLGADGGVRGGIHFDEGRQTWGHALHSTDSRLLVIGATEASDGSLHNTFVEVDTKLVVANRVATRNGGFLPSAATSTDLGRTLIAGSFLDDAATIHGVPRAAASRIDLKSGKYLWSQAMPDDDEVRDAIATTDLAEGAVILARSPDAMRVLRIDTKGRAGRETRLPNRICHFNDATQYRGSVYVVGTACDEGGRLYLLRVPRATAGSAIVLEDFDPRGSLLLQPSGQWQYVSGSANRLAVVRGPLE